MAMLQLIGTVLHTFKAPDFTDRETKQTVAGRHKVQMACENTLKNGERKIELVTLSTDEPERFTALQGRSVGVPVGAFPNGTGVNFYMVEGQVTDMGEPGEGFQFS